MSTNKPVIIWSSIITVVALVISVILQALKLEYFANLFAGIFASGVLTVMIGIINYRAERKKTLEKFYTYASKAANNFARFENDGNLERSIDSVLRMNEFDYTELDSAYGDICFIFKDKKNRQFIYDKIYGPILTTRNLIAEKCFHFREYRKALNGNTRVMRDFVNEIACVMLGYTEMKSIQENGVSMIIKCTRNKVAEDLYTELNNNFYSIMYPHSKEDKNHAD